MGDDTAGGSVAAQVEATMAAMAETISQLRGDNERLQHELAGRQQAATVQAPAAPTVPAPVVQKAGDLPKMPKPRPYSGSQLPGAVDNFIFACSLYFDYHSLPQDRRVFFAASLLEGAAQTWWRFACEQAGARMHELMVWGTFESLLVGRFRTVNATRHARDKLASLRQTGSVHEYVRQFQELVMQIPGIDHAEQLDRFVRGLKTQTRREVIMREPLTLDEAVRMADRYDSLISGMGFSGLGDRFSGSRSGQFRGPNPRFAADPVLPDPAPTPMEIDALNRRKPLTQTERERLRKLGGCFRCRQLGHIAPNCPNYEANPNRPAPKPRVNQVEQTSTEQPDLIDWGPEPRGSENSMPQ